jgi:glycyl-tRNA synthetase
MADSLDPVLNLAKRRGFFFQSADIYGGAGGIFDLGPLGVELNNNIKQLWWKRFVQQREDMVGIDAAILTIEPVLRASGHVDSFSDPLIECNTCHIRLRADHYLEEDSATIWLKRWQDEAAKQRGTSSKKDEQAALDAAQYFFDLSDLENPKRRTDVSFDALVCPNPECRKQTYGEPRQFNMMFKTNLGAVETDGSVAYLRPETAQGIFTNFKNVLDTSRRKLPFGIAQIGKAFRNEITVGNSLFRVRELEQMEIEYFVMPGEDEKMHEMWIEEWEKFVWEDLGLRKENVRRYEHPKASLSHYSKRTVDLEYNFLFGGFGELNGIANRTDYDLKQHQEHSGKDLTYFDEEKHERLLPYVIEPTMGVGRAFLAVLIDAYKEYPQGREGNGTESESVLHIARHLAPIKVAVLPLMKKDGLADKAREIYADLRQDYMCQYDESGAIGRRYRRQDEIGTPLCVTVDYQSLEDGTVTIRERDTMEQQRIHISNLGSFIAESMRR